MKGYKLSLLEKLEEAANRGYLGPGLPCGVTALLQKLEGEEKKVLELLFSTPAGKNTIANTKLHEILIGEGHNIAFASIRHHRSKQCRCFTGAHGLLRKKPKSIITAS